MKYKIRNLVIDVFGWVTLILVVFFFFTMWLFNYNDIEQPLQSAWGLSVTMLSGLATLAAAYMASKLFNKWEDQHNKQVNSDFIMKLYDCLFEMRQLSTSSVGFIRDYLTKENKDVYKDELIINNQRLCHLIDFSALKLSDVAYVITEEDYENIFSGQITIIIEELCELNDLYKLFINTTHPNAVKPKYKQYNDKNKIDECLSETLISLNYRYRGFLVELKKYYMA